MRFVATASSSDGRRLEIEWLLPPGARLAALAHRHPAGPEHWKILEGEVIHKVAGKKHRAGGGDQWTVPTDTSHVHPRNVGSHTAVARQWIETGEPDHDLLGGIERFFETNYAFAQRGQVNSLGMIKNPLRDMLNIWENLVPGSYIAGIPTPFQRLALGSGAALARRLGYQSFIVPELD